jgi:hypothetical protein
VETLRFSTVRKTLFLLWLCSASLLFGQGTGGVGTASRFVQGASLPSTCATSQVFYNGGTFYGCTATNTWTALTGSGGSGTVTSVTFTGDGTILSSTPSSAVTTSGTLTATLANTPTGTGGVVLATSPTLVTPALGAATATSLLATGIVDGQAPVVATTGSSCTIGTASGCTTVAYNSGYVFNQETTPSTAVTYTLPTPAAGLQYCFKNSVNSTPAADTGTIKILVATKASQFIDLNGTETTTTNGYIISGGAAGDAACVVGVSSTLWEAFVSQGTWTAD